MRAAQTVDRLWEIAEPLARQGGFEIVDIEHRAERGGMVVRVFLDREEGVNLDQLSGLSRELGDLIEVHQVLTGPYTLEVSSPGINRPLTRPAHYARYLGRRVRVQTALPVAGQRKFLGTLREANDSDIVLELDDGMRTEISLANVARANYEHDFRAARPQPRRGKASKPPVEKRRRA